MCENKKPYEIIFEYFRNNIKVDILERMTDAKYRGWIAGFDEFMNIVLSDGTRRFLIKGDCISCIFPSEE